MQMHVTWEYLKGLLANQENKCSLSGVSIELSSYTEDHKSGKTTASLDRIDSTKGYIEGNLQWVHKIINFMKRDLTQNEFIDMCRKVTETHCKIEAEVDKWT